MTRKQRRDYAIFKQGQRNAAKASVEQRLASRKSKQFALKRKASERMSFDPNKVERELCRDDANGYQIGDDATVEMVRASDYDALLALYLELQREKEYLEDASDPRLNTVG